MILFRADANLTPSISIFGKWVYPCFVCHDFLSSTESTISTSLIHNIASEVKRLLRDLKILLINHVILWIRSFWWKEGISGWSPCESRRWYRVSISLFTSSYSSSRAWSHQVSICKIKIPRVKHSSGASGLSKNVSRCTRQIPCIKSQALVAAQHTTKTWNNCISSWSLASALFEMFHIQG